MKMNETLKQMLNRIYGEDVMECYVDTDNASSCQHIGPIIVMPSREKALLLKVIELEKNNEKLEAKAEDGCDTHALRERIDELEERCETYLEYIEKFRKATMVVGDIAKFGTKKECVTAIDKLNAMVVELQENMLWCDDNEDDDEEGGEDDE